MTPEPSPLYPYLTDAAWLQLDAAVRAAHLDRDAKRLSSRGSFSIRHGGSRVARGLVRLLRMPAAGDAVETRLVITREAGTERWRRTFAGQPMVTVQEARPGRLLAERVGLMELRFRLEVEGGALVYRQAGAYLRLGRLCIPIPRWLSPRAAAREEAAGLPGRTRVAVEVVLPLVGLLIRYAGELELERAGEQDS